MEIIKVDIDKLTPDPQNAKEHPAWQIEQIKASIETFGNLDPIGVWGDDNLIVEGYGRYIALYENVKGDHDDFKPELIKIFFDAFDYCKEMFLFGADYFAELIPDKNAGSWLVWDKRKESQADAIGSEFELIWSKNKHKRRMLRHDWFGFLSSEDGADARHRVHPTQKPVSLLTDILKQWGEKADLVVDLYGGSGSTLIACDQLNKTCYLCELEPHYCDVILKRWEDLTDGKAVLLNGES